MNAEQSVEVGMWPEPATSGQHVGMPKGVKVTHKPTGIIVICGTERSQHANRQKALDFIARALEQREGFVMVPMEPTPEIIAGAAAAIWPTASAADIELARKAAPIVLMSYDLGAGCTVDELAAVLATMAPAYRAMLAAAPKESE